MSQIYQPQQSGSKLFELANTIGSFSKTFTGGKSTTDSAAPQADPAGYNAAAPTQSEMPQITAPPIGDSAMSRRSEANNNHPDVVIAQGLKQLEGNTDLDDATKVEVAEHLMRAQHFGFGGGLDQKSVAQGSVDSGEQKNGNSAKGMLGNVISVAALV